MPMSCDITMVAGGRWQVAGGRWQVAGGRWQVQDSNLRRRKPTDLQSASLAVVPMSCVGCAMTLQFRALVALAMSSRC
jgi:hypothetical protein